MTLGANTLDRATNITPMGTTLATLESMADGDGGAADGDGEADGPAGIEEPPTMADMVEEAALADTVKNGQTILAFA